MSSSKTSSIIIMLVGFVFSLSVRAQETTSAALTFKTWKEQQILSAQNHLLRASADLESSKKSTEQISSSKKISSKERAIERFKTKSARSKLERSELETKQAQEGVKAAMDLTMEDYISVYLPTLSGNPANLEKLVEQLSKEELSKILAEILKRQSDQRDSQGKLNPRINQVLAAETRGQL